MSPTPKAVFLSYASQDAEAAQRICDALRAAGIEVWFDRNELVGGDAWDAKIRKQISECALFVPIISASTQARREGYFRLEWRLAAQRTHMMSESVAFLLPVVIDGTRDAEADVPGEFKAVQWTRLRPVGLGGLAPDEAAIAAFCRRVSGLLNGSAELQPALPPTVRIPRAVTVAPNRRSWTVPTALFAVAVLVALAVWRPWQGAKLKSPVKSDAAPISEASRLVAKAWEQLDKTEMARGELQLAESYCRQAIALDETNPSAWAAWSAMNTWYYFHGFERLPTRKQAAHDYAQKAIALNANSYEARYAWANFVVRMAADGADGKSGDEKPALPILRQLLKEKPDEPRALFALGFGLMMDPTDADEGFTILERLAEKHPWFAGRALNEVGWMALFYGRYALAESAAERAVKAQHYWNNLGLKATLALRLRGDLALAQATIDRLPPSALKENWGISLAVMVAEWRGDYPRAVSILQGVSRDWLENFFFWGPTSFASGRARYQAKQITASQQDFRRALDLLGQRLDNEPNDPIYLYYKAETLRLLGRAEEADKTYRQLQEVEPMTHARLTFAPPEQALDYIRQALQKDPTMNRFPPRYWFTPASLRLDPIFENVRQAPGFPALLREVEEREKQRWAAPGAAKDHKVPATPAVPEKSVAVLAFKNLSGDPAREFLCDGISEAVADVLGRIPGLKVPGSTSAFSFKNKAVPIPEIARQLGVAHVVEGAVLQEGSKVRITAKLLKADGFPVWVSEKLEREMKDIFALHDEVAGLIAKQLSLKLGIPRPEARREVNAEAYELFLQGRQAWNRRTLEDYQKAEALFTRAIDLDPLFARAYVGRADARVFLTSSRGQTGTWGQRQAPQLEPAAADLRRALELESDLAEAHSSLGNLQNFNGDPDAAAHSLRRAIELNPNYATAHQWLGIELWRRGFLVEARASVLRAAEIDPLSSVIAAACSVILLEYGDVAAALVHAERAVALQPDSWRAISVKAMILWTLGQHDAAVALARSVAEKTPSTQGLGRALLVLGRAGLVEEVEARRKVSGGRAELVRLQGAVALGRWDEFFAAWGPTVLTVDDPWYLYASDLDAVRSDPRFLAPLREAGLLEAHARIQAWRAAHPLGKVERKK